MYIIYCSKYLFSDIFQSLRTKPYKVLTFSKQHTDYGKILRDCCNNFASCSIKINQPRNPPRRTHIFQHIGQWAHASGSTYSNVIFLAVRRVRMCSCVNAHLPAIYSPTEIGWSSRQS